MDYLQYDDAYVRIVDVKTVLNLVINGLPSIQAMIWLLTFKNPVLNLVINGLPSILSSTTSCFSFSTFSFKPCYKWTTFNTKKGIEIANTLFKVLNLVINGLPSIHYG